MNGHDRYLTRPKKNQTKTLHQCMFYAVAQKHKIMFNQTDQNSSSKLTILLAILDYLGDLRPYMEKIFFPHTVLGPFLYGTLSVPYYKQKKKSHLIRKLKHSSL